MTLAQNAARILRWPLGLAALVVAYGAFDYSAATNLRRANPETAYRARPTDPAAIAAAMNDRMVIRNMFAPDADDIAHARIGLGQDPLNRVLLRTLGVHGEISGDIPRALAAMQMADRVSRRDSIAQMWLAEYLRRQGQTSRSVVHYSAAMQVSPALQQILFPQMVPQLANAKFRDAVRPYITGGTGWTMPFVGTAAAQDTQATVELVSPILPAMAGKGYDKAFAEIVYRQMMRGEHGEARQFAAAAFPGFSAKAFDHTGWSKATTDYRLGRLAWTFDQSGGVSSTLDDKGRLSVDISPLTRETIAQRAIPVSAGKSYRLIYRFTSSADSAAATLQWNISCLRPQGREVIWQSQATPIRGGAEVNQGFNVPPNCYLVQLDAIAVGPETQLPMTFTLSDVDVLAQ